MAHIVGQPPPDFVVTKDAHGGPAMLIDMHTRERVEFSDEATAILDVDGALRLAAAALARNDGVCSAADEVELGVRILLGAGESERREAERAVLETLADIAVREWFATEKGRQ